MIFYVLFCWLLGIDMLETSVYTHFGVCGIAGYNGYTPKQVWLNKNMNKNKKVVDISLYAWYYNMRAEKQQQKDNKPR